MTVAIARTSRNILLSFRVSWRGPLVVRDAPLCPVQGLVPERMGLDGSRASGPHDEYLRARRSQVRLYSQRGANATTNLASNIALPLSHTRQRSGEYNENLRRLSLSTVLFQCHVQRQSRISS